MRLMSDKYERIASENGIKKKWMHWSTYYELMEKANDYEGLAETILLKKLCKLSGINYLNLV